MIRHLDRGAPKSEIYDLEKDPREKSRLDASAHPKTELLSNEMTRIVKENRKREREQKIKSVRGKYSEKTKQQLRSLGYINSSRLSRRQLPNNTGKNIEESPPFPP